MGSKGSVFYNTYVCQTQQTTPWNMEAWPEERLIENLPKFLILTIIITKNQEKSDLRITDKVLKSSKTISLSPLIQAFLNGVHPTLFFASKSIFGEVKKSYEMRLFGDFQTVCSCGNHYSISSSE